MIKPLVKLFIIKLYARNVFTRVKKNKTNFLKSHKRGSTSVKNEISNLIK